MTLGTGFGNSGPWGVDPWGQTNFARKILLENIPQCYIEADPANDYIFTKFIKGLFPTTNEFRVLLDNFPLIRNPERLPGDAINILVVLNDLQSEIQIVLSTLPLVVAETQLTIVGENPAETITVAVLDVQNDLSRIEIGTPFPFDTSVRFVRVGTTTYPFLVTNGSVYITAVPDLFPDVKVGDFILIGSVQSVVVSTTPELFKFSIIPSPVVSPTPQRVTIMRLSRLVLLTLLAKDYGLTDDPTKPEIVRRGIVLHCVEYFKLKGTAKGYVARGGLEGLKVEVSNYQEVPCAKTLATVIPIAIGTMQAVLGSLIGDGEGFVLADVAHGAKSFEFDKDGQAQTVFLANDAMGAVGNIAVTETVANPNFKVFGMATGNLFAPARGSIISISGALLVDGETFTLNDGVNPPTVFEFDNNGSVIPGNISVVFNAGMPPATVRSQIQNAINGVGVTLAITASAGSLIPITNVMSAAAIAIAVETAVSSAVPFNVTALSTSSTVDFRNDVEGLVGVLPIFSFFTNIGFTVVGLLPYNGIASSQPPKTRDPIPYISGFDVVPTDTVPVDSPSYQKYFDVGNPDTGQITAIPGIQLGDGETFTLYDDENLPVVFEFDKDNSIIGMGNVPVQITNAMTAVQVALVIEAAINSLFMNLRITATNPAATPIVNLRMDTSSAHVRPSLTMLSGVATADAKKITLSDDVNPPTTFEFDKNGFISAGSIQVPITNAMSANTVATTLAFYINAQGAALLLTATVSNNTIMIVKNVLIRDTVVDPGFIVVGMSGGTSSESALFPVVFASSNAFFRIVGAQFTYNPGPLPNQITLLSTCDLLVGDIVDFGLQLRTVTLTPGASPMPEFPGLRITGTIISFDLALVGLTPNSQASRVSRAPDISTFGDFLTIAGFDYKVVQYNSSSFAGTVDLALRDVTLVNLTLVATRTRRRAVTRRPAYDFCRLPILKLRMEAVPASIFYSGFENALKFVKALDEVRPIHVRFADVEFAQTETIVVPIPNVTATSLIASSSFVEVDNYYDTMAAEDTPADSTKVVTVETP
jgi:hypothetical protein